MKNPLWLRTLTLLAVIALVTATRTAGAKLTVGDPAPKLQAGKWVQGEPVKAFDTNHVYLVEFWATWCGPCRVSIPHLNELWLKFKNQGLVVVGQDVWEDNEESVAPFVKKMGGQMTYRVALDDKSGDTNGAMAVTWMKAAEQNGIPTAFLVNRQGRIAWIGHPMELDEKLLNDVLANRHDTAKAATEFAQREQNQQQLKELFKKFSASLKAENWSEAEAAVTEIEKLLPADQREGAGPLRLQIFLGRKDYVGFYKLAAAFSDAHPSNVSLQNDLAWFIVTQPDLPQRDLALAARCAERANQASQGKEPAILDTLARVQFMSGKTNEAVATELKAVNLAKDQEKGGLEKSLADYRAGKLPEIK